MFECLRIGISMKCFFPIFIKCLEIGIYIKCLTAEHVELPRLHHCHDRLHRHLLVNDAGRYDISCDMSVNISCCIRNVSMIGGFPCISHFQNSSSCQRCRSVNISCCITNVSMHFTLSNFIFHQQDLKSLYSWRVPDFHTLTFT